MTEASRVAVEKSAVTFQYLPSITNGQMRGLGAIYGMIQVQAMMLSFNDIYRFLSIFMLILVPAFLLLKRGGGGAPVAAH